MTPRLCSKSRFKSRERELIDKGTKKIGNALDLMHLIKLQQRMKTMEYLLLNRKQRILNKLSKLNYLRCSSTENSNIESDELIDDLFNYKISGKLDKRLLQNMEIKEKQRKLSREA